LYDVFDDEETLLLEEFDIRGGDADLEGKLRCCQSFFYGRLHNS
jgi:hypothetical protein